MNNPQHSETPHSPLPWIAGDGIKTNIFTEGGLRVARCDFDGDMRPDPVADANAAHIVLCVNGRDALVEALKPFANLLHPHHAEMPDDRPVWGINNVSITAGDLRAARDALKKAGAM